MSLPNYYDLYSFKDRTGLITFYENKVRQITMPIYSEADLPALIQKIEPIKRKASSLSNDLKAYFKGENIQFAGAQIDLSAYTGFEREVLQAAMTVGYGRTSTYRSLASSIGRPNASRAVGNALGKNQALILVPCHRIIGSNSGLGGFSQGLEWKKFMLGLERTGVNELKVMLESI